MQSVLLYFHCVYQSCPTSTCPCRGLFQSSYKSFIPGQILPNLCGVIHSPLVCCMNFPFTCFTDTRVSEQGLGEILCKGEILSPVNLNTLTSNLSRMQLIWWWLKKPKCSYLNFLLVWVFPIFLWEKNSPTSSTSFLYKIKAEVGQIQP